MLLLVSMLCLLLASMFVFDGFSVCILWLQYLFLLVSLLCLLASMFVLPGLMLFLHQRLLVSLLCLIASM